MSKKIITNIILVMFLGMLWLSILTLSAIICTFNQIVCFFQNEILKYIFALIYGISVIVPVIFRKKLSIAKSLPLTMIASAAIAVVINAIVFFGVRMYIDEYSKDKWDANPLLRVYMVDDLEREHQIIGMTEEEVKALLGEPGAIPEWGQRRFEYLAGDSWVDPYTYDVLFENGVAVETRIWEH